jgi:hypothetical protein
VAEKSGNDIREGLKPDDAKVIFSNKDHGLAFLDLIGEPIKKGSTAPEVWRKIAEEWDYETARGVIRRMFKESQKYKEGVNAGDLLPKLVEEWEELALGPIRWPTGQAQFDLLAQSINKRRTATRSEKDFDIQQFAVRFRRMKELATARNDFIETLVFEHNEHVIPTLSHVAGTDFFINGTAYDQKVSRSVGKKFQDRHPEDWREQAIRAPGDLARSLLEEQGEGRFSSTPRLYIIDVDGAAFNAAQIREVVENVALSDPLEVAFEYKHSGAPPKAYKTKCIVGLLLDPEG